MNKNETAQNHSEHKNLQSITLEVKKISGGDRMNVRKIKNFQFFSRWKLSDGKALNDWLLSTFLLLQKT